MSVTINFTGDLILDQTAGLQADDVNVDATGAVLSGDLDSDFLSFLNTQGLNSTQADFAALVEGASDPNLVTITADAGETIGKLFFSTSTGDDFTGETVPGVTTLSGDPLFFWSADNGKVVLIKDGGGTIVAAMYIEPTNADHTTAVVQTITFQPLLHPDATDPNDPVDFSDVLRVSAVITQNAGDHIVVLDDAPTIATSGNPPTLTVDETTLTTDATDSFAGNFTHSFGTDGAGSLTYALGISSPGADSGIIDTASGQHVLLSLNGGVVEGRTAIGNDLVFTISVDASANVTLDQLRAVVHTDTTNPDDSTTLSAANLVTLNAHIVDGDGDAADAHLDIGQSMVFKDDGPSISATGIAPALTVDETDLTVNDTQSFAANFTSAYGADNAGSLVYSLGVISGASGLTDTATGQSVILSVNGSGVVEGRTSGSNDLVFTVSVNAAGDVTLDQLRAVVHPDATNPDDSVTLSAADLVTLTATITDKDGDTAQAHIDIGQNLNFHDDGPSISANDTSVSLTVDESFLSVNDTKDFSTQFTSQAGADGDAITYALSAIAGPSGIVDTATNQAVNLSVVGGVVQGRTAISNDLVFTVSVDAAGHVTLDQLRAVVHPDATNPNDSVTLSADNLVTLTATITDKDGDTAQAHIDIGQNLNFLDDGPSISESGTTPTVTVDETNLGTAATQNFAGLFHAVAGADGDAVAFSLSVGGLGATGLLDTKTGESVSLSLNSVTHQIEAKDTDGDLVFTVGVNAAGDVTLDQFRAVSHADPTNPNDVDTLANDNLVVLTATITDKDGDTASAFVNIGKSLAFVDDAPVVTVPVSYPAGATTLDVGNQVGDSNTGSFGYNIGNDAHTAAFYAAGGSDFIDQNPLETGVQIGLTGTVGTTTPTAITQADVTLATESASSAVFNFSFHYDKDPITAGVQDATAGGTLTFDKVADTFTVALTDVVDGFDFSVLHTNELLAKQPTGNTGHPNIVVEALKAPTTVGGHDGFFVQFTADNSPFGFSSDGQGGNTGDHTFTGSAHDMVGGTPTWVSATQDTNGVAGDTIQSGENLTLRFFNSDILGDVATNTEQTTPTATAGGVAIKFDGIGSNEDLVMILDLKDSITGQSITRAVVVENGDIIKHTTPGGVPAPYNSEFTLDNNDGLVILENNDYNAAGEHYQIQGMQIMQSANGLTGVGINLNGATGATGGSNVTSNLEAFNFAGSHTTDVLKITDIGFVEQTTGTVPANLDFNFQVADADGDPIPVQHIDANISNLFNV